MHFDHFNTDFITHIKVVVVQQLCRCCNIDVTRVILPPAVDKNSSWPVAAEVTLLDGIQITEEQLLGIVSVLSGLQHYAHISVCIKLCIDGFFIFNRSPEGYR